VQGHGRREGLRCCLAAQLPAADALQPLLRCGFRARLRRSDGGYTTTGMVLSAIARCGQGCAREDGRGAGAAGGKGDVARSTGEVVEAVDRLQCVGIESVSARTWQHTAIMLPSFGRSTSRCREQSIPLAASGQTAGSGPCGPLCRVQSTTWRSADRSPGNRASRAQLLRGAVRVEPGPRFQESEAHRFSMPSCWPAMAGGGICCTWDSRDTTVVTQL